MQVVWILCRLVVRSRIYSVGSLGTVSRKVVKWEDQFVDHLSLPSLQSYHTTCTLLQSFIDFLLKTLLSKPGMEIEGCLWCFSTSCSRDYLSLFLGGPSVLHLPLWGSMSWTRLRCCHKILVLGPNRFLYHLRTQFPRTAFYLSSSRFRNRMISTHLFWQEHVNERSFWCCPSHGSWWCRLASWYTTWGRI